MTIAIRRLVLGLVAAYLLTLVVQVLMLVRADAVAAALWGG